MIRGLMLISALVAFFVAADANDPRVLVLVDASVYPEIEDGLSRYFDHVKNLHSVKFEVLDRSFYEMDPPAIRALLKEEHEKGMLEGAIMVGPIPHALKGDPKTLVFPAPLFYEELDAQWIDRNGDGIYERVESDRKENATEIWTAWWVPPANDAPTQVEMLKTFLAKLDRYYSGGIRGCDGVVFIAGNGNSVEITESWTVLLEDGLRPFGQKVAKVFSAHGQMKQTQLPDPGPDYKARDFIDMLTRHQWQHVHTLTHGSPEGFYWHNGEAKIAVTADSLDFSLFKGTGPVVFTTSGCSNGVFRGTLKTGADYSRSMGNRLLFHPDTLTVAYFGSSSPQSASVFAGFHTELVEGLQAGGIARGYYNLRNMDYSWGLQHHIFRGVDGKILNGDPFVRYNTSGKEVSDE